MLKKAVLCLSIIVLSSTGTLASGRPSSCPPRAWCGCYLSHYLGLHRRDLWLARNWASVGRPVSPGVGAIVVWRHHVGIITGKTSAGWIVHSGNDGRAVRSRPRSISGAIAFRGLHGSSMSVRETHRSQDQVTVWQGHNQKAAGRRSRLMPEVLASVSRQTEN